MLSGDPWTELRAAGRELAEALQATNDRINHLLEEAAQFGERGWPLNPDWDSEDLASVVDAFDEATHDEVFVAFYEADGGARIRHTFESLESRKSMKRWLPIIRQADEALQREHFALIIPALLTVLEGRVFSDPKQATNVRKEIQRIREEQHDGFSKMVWLTIVEYVNALFANSNFEAEEPHFNRHWILHGRSSARWERSDVVRLLHGIDVIDVALSNPV